MWRRREFLDADDVLAVTFQGREDLPPRPAPRAFGAAQTYFHSAHEEFHVLNCLVKSQQLSLKDYRISQIPILVAFEMVSTRGHPQDFPEPDLTPSKTTPSRTQRRGTWAHTPSNLTIIWLFISLPLVAWDTGYVMLRPLSMPGGSLHWPLWTPYELYGKVDYIYGWKAFNEHNGFTAAQGLLNIFESLLYAYYLYIVYAYGQSSTAQGRGAPKASKLGFLSQQRYVDGKQGALAVLVAYSAAVMTVSKTVLYCESILLYRIYIANTFQG